MFVPKALLSMNVADSEDTQPQPKSQKVTKFLKFIKRIGNVANEHQSDSTPPASRITYIGLGFSVNETIARPTSSASTSYRSRRTDTYSSSLKTSTNAYASVRHMANHNKTPRAPHHYKVQPQSRYANDIQFSTHESVRLQASNLIVREKQHAASLYPQGVQGQNAIGSSLGISLGPPIGKFDQIGSHILHSQYTVLQVLGEGGFGTVLLCSPQANPMLESSQSLASIISSQDSAYASLFSSFSARPLQYVVKLIQKDKIPIASYVRDPQTDKTIPFEILALRQCSHPNIIETYNWFEDSKNFYLVMESITSHIGRQSSSVMSLPQCSFSGRTGINDIECMDLWAFTNRFGKMSEQSARKVIQQLISAVRYLHCELGICHRDIKDENVLIDSNCYIKLIDFGASALLYNDEHELRKFTQFHGTIKYASPEVVKKQSYTGLGVDSWTLGILLFSIVFGVLPFRNEAMMVELLLKPDFSIRNVFQYIGLWSSCGSEGFTDHMFNEFLRTQQVSMRCMDFIERLLHPDPAFRITVDAASRHLWPQNDS